MALSALTALAVAACGQVSARRDSQTEDPALLAEQHRRIAAFDSVVRTINTDSVYKLWRWSLTLAAPKVGQQQVQCEVDQMMFHYGAPASMAALRRMQDTLWRGVDPQQVGRLRRGLEGESLPVTSAICGPRTTEKAPYWLREWYIYPLPQLPPSPTDSAPRLPYAGPNALKRRPT